MASNHNPAIVFIDDQIKALCDELDKIRNIGASSFTWYTASGHPLVKAIRASETTFEGYRKAVAQKIQELLLTRQQYLYQFEVKRIQSLGGHVSASNRIPYLEKSPRRA